MSLSFAATAPFRAIEDEKLYDEILRLAPDGSVGWKDGALVLILPRVDGELCLRSADGVELPVEYLEGRLRAMRDPGRQEAARADGGAVRDDVYVGHREDRLAVAAGEGPQPAGPPVDEALTRAGRDAQARSGRVVTTMMDATAKVDASYTRGVLRADAYRAEQSDRSVPPSGLGDVVFRKGLAPVDLRIAVTPGMIAAGARAVGADVVMGASAPEVAERVFRAMIEAHNEGDGS